MITPDHDAFGTVSASVMETFGRVTPVVKTVSMDEAFLGIRGAGRTPRCSVLPALLSGVISHRLAWGEDQRVVTSRRGAEEDPEKSTGADETFGRDTDDPEVVQQPPGSSTPSGSSAPGSGSSAPGSKGSDPWQAPTVS